jgi:hypothetical protein
MTQSIYKLIKINDSCLNIIYLRTLNEFCFPLPSILHVIFSYGNDADYCHELMRVLKYTHIFIYIYILKNASFSLYNTVCVTSFGVIR